ncbi:MAG: hypothetical protein KIT11_07025 [Fimbriimonadaceae bacterium]|nr:hypothetical protein [Fimbriimonadaceae bacterium]QYK56104.1 MAG: hypothetical protein KF733_01215 [Fimbriimonadaceae bacterium]
MRPFALATALFPALCLAQLGGPGQYPQYRSMSGLPGSGYGVRADGSIGMDGAMSISSPIGYSLSDWHAVFGLGNLSADLAPTFFRGRERDLGGNGTGQILLGVSLGKYGSLTATHMILSNKLDNAQNFVWAPPGQKGALRYVIGVQDVSGQGGTAGEQPDGTDPGESRSYFLAATYEVRPGTHVSAGFGDTRFRRGFASASHNLTPRLKAVAEHDGYNWNAGLGYDFGQVGTVRDRGVRVYAFAGVMRGEFAYWSLNVGF